MHFIGLALNESLNVVLFYISDTQNACNPGPDNDSNLNCHRYGSLHFTFCALDAASQWRTSHLLVMPPSVRNSDQGHEWALVVRIYLFVMLKVAQNLNG